MIVSRCKVVQCVVVMTFTGGGAAADPIVIRGTSSSDPCASRRCLL